LVARATFASPLVRFVLVDGQGAAFPVDHAGRMLQVSPWGQVIGVVGLYG
jgi:hypothetical protein